MLKTEELTAVLALYQQVSLQIKQLERGTLQLEMSFAVFNIVNRIYLASSMATHPIAAEQQSLLKMLKCVQSLSINGKNLHRSCDIDLVCFPGLFTLRVEKLSVRTIDYAVNVSELSLVDCAIEEDFFQHAFLALRSIEFERTPVNSKFLSSLAFTLRRFSIKHNDVDLDKTAWRAQTAESGLISWHALTHISIRTHRPIFTELDHSWERLTNLAVLSLTAMGLPDLKGIDALKHCINLVALDISYNQLSSLQRLAVVTPSLIRLNASHNSLSAIDGVPELKELRHLSLEGNTIHEWAELRDIAEGCQKLQTLDIRGNPILSQIDEQVDVVPFVASIFQFRPLLVDGVRSEATRSKVNAAFLGKHMGLFERNRGMTDGVASEMPIHTRRTIGDAESTHRAVSMPTRRSMAARSVASERTLDGSPRKRRVVTRGKVVPDKQEAEIALPKEQLDTIDPTSPSYVDVENLAEKHKERWLTAVSAQSAVTNRAKKRELAKEPAASAAGSPTASTGMSSSGTGAQQQQLTPAPVQRVKRVVKVIQKPTGKIVPAEVEVLTSPRRPAAKSVASKPVTSEKPTAQDDEEYDSDEADRAARKDAAVKAAMEATAQTAKSSGAAGARLPQRQAPQRDPTPLFQSFLQSLSSMDWAYVVNDKRQKGFPSGCQTYLSRICEENEALWGIVPDDVTTPTVHHTAVEVLLHDSNDSTHTTSPSRHVDKKLVRVIDVHCGHTRTVRVEVAVHSDRNSLPDFEGRPACSVNFLTPLPTQPADSYVDVKTGLPQRAKKPSFAGGSSGDRARSNSELDRAIDLDIDTSRISRNILRCERQVLLAAFVVDDTAVGDMFVNVLKLHIQSCHSRLCETKIMREWPLYLDESAVKRDSERSVRVDMTVANVLDRVKNNTDEDANRQRIGCPDVMISSEELRINLTTEVFPKIARERFLSNVYGNLVQFDSDVDESAVLLIVTQKTFLIARDHNFRGRGGCATPDTAFELIQAIPVAKIKTVLVSFNLQTIRIHTYIVQLRDSGTVLSLLSSLMTATENALVIEVAKCPYKDITNAPLIFSAGLFMRVIGQRRQVDRDTTAFPLRHIEEAMIPVSFVITATDVVLLMERDTMTDEVSVKKLTRQPLNSIVAFGVASAALNPLLFSIQYSNLEKGKREQWVFAAQHPNTIAAIYSELRQTQGQRMNVVDFTEAEYRK